ncbi:glycosyltransferase [Aquimarina sp. 2-A2]|uniref:glycosyltransferase n=1 Tax=Aquimarina sp. 2-A2 TaxID=3382644 RepID=UPI00387F16DE
MKRILLLMPYGSVGGMERLAYSFYRFYKDNGYQVKAVKFIKLESDIIHFDHEGNDEFFLSNKDFSEMSKLQRIQFYFEAPIRLAKLIKKERITHSIAFGDMANLFSSLTFTNEFKVGSIHALKSVEFANKSFFNTIFKKSYRTSYKNLDKVVCISKDIKTDLIDNCNFKFVEKLEVIYNPHNFEEINRLSDLPITDKNEVDIFNNPVVLFIGRICIQKSPWHLIKAFYLVLKEYPETKLVFIGDGDKKVENYVRSLLSKYGMENSVIFLGRKNNPYNYLKQSNVLALSSHYEGTPNVIVESIGVGTPVVSSFCTRGITELMSLTNITTVDSNIEVASGIVSPNLFKGDLGIPESEEFLEEEKYLSEALKSVLKTSDFKQNLKKHRFELIQKFDLEVVSNRYLQPIK